MGVANSKRKYSSGPIYSTDFNTEADKPPEEGDAAAAADAAKPPPSAEELSMKEIKKWKGFLKDIISLKDAKSTIKDLELEENIKKKEAKGIIVTADYIKKFVSADKEFLPDVMLYFGTVGLPAKFDFAAAEPLTEPNAEKPDDPKKLKKDTAFDAAKPIYDSLVEATRVAKKHAVFRKIITEYVADSDRLKDFMKEQNISGAKDKIIDKDSSDSTGAVKDAKAAIKEKETGPEPPADAKGGAVINQSGGTDTVSGDQASDNSSYNDYNSDGGSVYSLSSSDYQGSGGSSSYASGDELSIGTADISVGSAGGDGDSITGGVGVPGFRSAEQKKENKQRADYKKFKKEARGDFKKKMKTFFDDNEAMAKFMDANEADLLGMVYYGKIPGKWIDKSNETAKQNIAQNLVTAINEYTPKEDKPADGAEKKEDGAEKKEDGAEKPADGAENPADGAEKKEDGAKEEEENPAARNRGGGIEQASAVEQAQAVEQASATGGQAAKPAQVGGQAAELLQAAAQIAMQPAQHADSQTGQQPTVMQGGGGSKTDKKKKKKNPRQINISINVGNKNIIASDTSSSSSSDSSSSDSSSSSDDEDSIKKYVVNKGSKQKKHKKARQSKI